MIQIVLSIVISEKKNKVCSCSSFKVVWNTKTWKTLLHSSKGILRSTQGIFQKHPSSNARRHITKFLKPKIRLRFVYLEHWIRIHEFKKCIVKLSKHSKQVMLLWKPSKPSSRVQRLYSRYSHIHHSQFINVCAILLRRCTATRWKCSSKWDLLQDGPHYNGKLVLCLRYLLGYRRSVCRR